MPALLARVLAALLCLAAVGGCGEEGPPPRGTTSPAKPSTGDRLGPYPRSEFFFAHDRFLAADDPVDLVVAGSARAYAISMLAYHHVVNDVIAGTPVAVTY